MKLEKETYYIIKRLTNLSENTVNSDPSATQQFNMKHVNTFKENVHHSKKLKPVK